MRMQTWQVLNIQEPVGEMEKDWLGSWRKPGAGGCVDSNAREYSKKEKKRKRSMVSKTDEYPHFFLMFNYQYYNFWSFKKTF